MECTGGNGDLPCVALSSRIEPRGARSVPITAAVPHGYEQSSCRVLAIRLEGGCESVILGHCAERWHVRLQGCNGSSPCPHRQRLPIIGPIGGFAAEPVAVPDYRVRELPGDCQGALPGSNLSVERGKRRSTDLKRDNRVTLRSLCEDPEFDTCTNGHTEQRLGRALALQASEPLTLLLGLRGFNGHVSPSYGWKKM
jgi:hypothetical protein